MLNDKTYSMSSLRGIKHAFSLIPRPSHCPVFDRLQYAKMEGEGLHGPFYHVNDVSVYLGQQKRGRSL